MQPHESKPSEGNAHGKRRDLLRCTFLALWLFVIAVSVIDGYLAFRHRATIMSFELNPIGRLLIQWNGGGVTYLLAAKFLGTVAACAILLLLWKASANLGLVVASALACTQLLLLIFLLVG